MDARLAWCDRFMSLHETVATMSVHENAWFSEGIMHEWIQDMWRHEVTGPTVLILDSLRIHKCESVQNALADLGTFPVYVPGGCTSVAQPLDVGIMGPFKKRLRELYVIRHAGGTPPSTAPDRRKDMFERTIIALKDIKPESVKNAFFKSGPFLPMGPLSSSGEPPHQAMEVVV